MGQQADTISRRYLLRTAGAGAVLLLLSGKAAGRQAEHVRQKPAAPAIPIGIFVTQAAVPFTPDVELALTATASTSQILSGAPTSVWTYRGEVLKGDPHVLQPIPNSYLGPIIRVHYGQKVRIWFKNELPEASIIHWHGLLVPAAMDGHPTAAVGPGQTYIYEFEVKNRAGTYWYHPAPAGRTGYQVNAGLAGLLLVSDQEEATLDLPQADQDLPLVIQDRLFDDNNQFTYVSPSMGSPIDQLTGFLGDKILVNGQADVHLPLATHVYRLRLLNGSNARIYKLAWSNGMPLTVIATDGGLLEKPVQRDYVMLAPGERVDLWVDLRQQSVGTDITLQSLAYTGVEAGMMGGMTRGESAVPNGESLDLLTLRVAQAATDTRPLPTKLATGEAYRLEDAVNRAHPRQITLGMRGMNWTLNGKAFALDAVTAEETVKWGSLEMWEFINPPNASGLMGNEMTKQGALPSNKLADPDLMDFIAHPMHIHGVQFQIIGRERVASDMADWQTIKDGLVDEGWKDTVLVLPGEHVKLLMRFVTSPGLYLYQCHNLEQADTGMMRTYRVTE